VCDIVLMNVGHGGGEKKKKKEKKTFAVGGEC